jgi:hypothetical protein
MLNGRAVITQRGNQIAPQILNYWEPSLFAQDDWRVTPKLTMNLGVRYDIFGPPTERQNRLSNFNVNTLSLVLASANDRKDGLSTGYGNVSPRVGFALSLPRQTVVRGAFGMSFFPGDLQGAQSPQNVPYFYNYSVTGLTSINNPLPTPISYDPTTIASNSQITIVNAKDTNLRTSYIEMFNLFAQKQLGEFVVTLGYVGELGRRRVFGSNLNEPLPPGAGNPTPAYRYATQFPYLTSISYVNNAGGSNYNAMQFEVQKRTAHGLTLNANYTYARGLDQAFSPSGSNGGPNSAELYNNPAYDYGNSDLDIRNRAAASATYELPFGKSLTGYKAALAKGWQFGALGFWQSGLPFTVLDGISHTNSAGASVTQSNQPAGGGGSTRPNVIANAKLSEKSLSQYFNTSAFQLQTFGTLGNEGRNQVYGPHDRRLDLSLLKTFSVFREAQLQFRAECFNITNTPNFSVPNSSFTAVDANKVATTAGGFGSITSTSPSEFSREFQFALKLNF